MKGEKQLTIFDAMAENGPEPEITVPAAAEGERVYTIPEDVWKTRCRYCLHRNAEKNVPIPDGVVWRYSYEKVLPCRIITICRPNDMPGECMSFAPIYNLYGICATCVSNNCFVEGFCTKADHAQQRRVYWGQTYNNNQPDYWGRHRLSVCDDYVPDAEDLIRPEEEGQPDD